jgi:hypothetical protein
MGSHFSEQSPAAILARADLLGKQVEPYISRAARWQAAKPERAVFPPSLLGARDCYA